jgi:hypothetical protein
MDELQEVKLSDVKINATALTRIAYLCEALDKTDTPKAELFWDELHILVHIDGKLTTRLGENEWMPVYSA